MSEQVQFSDIIGGRILEMVSENTMLNVPVHPSVNLDAITADDPDPKFVNVEVIRGGTVSGNNRRYSNDSARQVSAMVPGSHGFLGHPDPSKFGFEFREPQCIYVGSLIDDLGDGTVRCVSKAYLFKSSNLREWVPKSIAANRPMTVSINGRADVIRQGQFVDVVKINSLESIDWANPGTEGIDTSKAMSVVREMQENNDNGGTDMEVKEVLSNTTVTELKAYGPGVYEGVVKSITLTELKTLNPVLCSQIESSATITEMKVTIDGTEKSVKLTEMQSIIGGMEQKITELTTENAGYKIGDYRVAKIAELIPEDLREMVSKRVVGITEKEIDESIGREISYIREMRGLGANDPLGSTTRKDGGADTTKEAVRNMFGGSKKSEENK